MGKGVNLYGRKYAYNRTWHYMGWRRGYGAENGIIIYLKKSMKPKAIDLRNYYTNEKQKSCLSTLPKERT